MYAFFFLEFCRIVIFERGFSLKILYLGGTFESSSLKDGRRDLKLNRMAKPQRCGH